MMTMTRNTRLAALAAVALALGAGCGGTGAFGLTSDDNNVDRLTDALKRREPAKPGVINATGNPMLFAVVSGKPKTLIAYDLQAKAEVWRQQTDVSSRVLVGARFVAHREGDGKLVARAIDTGKETWSHAIEGTFVGAAADAERVYYVHEQTGSKPTWWLVALDGASGAELWRADAPGQLGAPQAQGGLVFSPFLKQWLSILDARTGAQLTRIRGIDAEISFIRSTSDNVFFGSKTGVFLLDTRAASGKKSDSTYGSAALPKEFVRSQYHADAFDPVQSGYSAFDRNRILWRASAAEGGALAFASDQVVVQTFRFFFGFGAKDGAMQWAYSHPRVDVIGSDHVGPVVAFASALGEIGALDPATGRRMYDVNIENPGGQLIGATFDADGWAPNDPGAEPNTVGALVAIARDRDARFNDVKQFAVAAIARLAGGDVTRDLLGIVQDERTQPKLYETVVEVLVQRADPAGLPALTEALSVEYDYITGVAPKSVGVIARAIAAMKGKEIDPAQRGAAVEALLSQLDAPETTTTDLTEIVKALGAIGGGAEIAPLRSFLLAYRTNPEFASQVEAVAATVDVLLDGGGAAERELVAYVAEEPRTQPSIAEYAHRALSQTPTR
jgi:hypothetical protein